MSDSESSKEMRKSKLFFNENKQSKNNEKEKQKKIIKSKREKENKNKKKYENNLYNREKNERLTDLFSAEIIKKEKFLVNKYSKTQKTLEKNIGSETNKNWLLKKSKFHFFQPKFEKKKICEYDVDYYGTSYKSQKNLKKFKSDSERNEISKSAETSKNKIEFKIKIEKFYNYLKDGKNREEKNNMNEHLEEYRSQENEIKNNHKIKNNKLNKNEIYENTSNKYFENIKNNKNLKLNENNKYVNKCILYRNNYIDDFIENKKILENIKIKRKEKKYKIKFNIIYIFYFYNIILNIIFFSQYIKCYIKKIEFASSYINLKTKGKGEIHIYSYSFPVSERPNIVSINNIINLTDINYNYYYYFRNSENDINNITLIWNTSPSSTNGLFSNGQKIIEIDLSYFDTSQINNMNGMFDSCYILKSLNLSNFNTSSVTSMIGMFSECRLLVSLDLSYFNTSQVNNMEYMFKGCVNLISLNLSNFNTSNVISMNYMFERCGSLISLDLSYFDTTSVTSMKYMFYGCNRLISLNLSNFNASSVTSIGQMLDGCISLKYVNLINAKINPNIISSTKFSGFPSYLYICTENHYWPKIFSLSNKQYVNCINNIFNFNYNENKSIIKCYKENIRSDNPCQMCGKNYFSNSGIINNTYMNCYINETVNQVMIDTSIYNTNENLINTININNLTNSNLTEESDINTVLISQLSISDYSSFDSSIIIEKVIEVKNRTELIQKIINNLLNKLNISYIDNGEDVTYKINNISIIITSTKNQNKNDHESFITIDLCKCENILKNGYNISLNDPLYILIIILEKEEGMKIPKIEYEIYYHFYKNNTITKLNLNLCKGKKIEISIPVIINDILDKYNPKSGYYNDICYKTTSESGTDISLKDRTNEFVDNNMTLCEENCDLISYNYTNKKVKCSCDVKTNINQNYDYKFDKNEFFKSFIDIKNIANINVMKCYKIVLNLKNLISNYGFYLIGSIMLLYIITIFIFIFISYKKIVDHLFNIFLDKINKIKKKPKVKDNENSTEKKIKKSKVKRKNNKINNDNIINSNIKNNTEIKLTNNIRDTIIDKNDKLSSKQNIKNISEIQSLDININYIYYILEAKDFEINSLEYEEAFKLDNRTYYQYYISLLKYNHPIMLSFGPYNDYNSRIIKIFLFFFSFSSDLTINALFFNDDTMHKIYKDRGKFDLLFQIPQILYSTLISKLIDSLIKNFALSQDIIVQLKKEKGKNYIKKKYPKLLKVFRIKIICFFVFVFIILSSFWYYIICFCGIYVNTQIHLIKDCIISLITSLIYSLAISLIPGLFRIPAVRLKKPCLYKFSSLFENYLV